MTFGVQLAVAAGTGRLIRHATQCLFVPEEQHGEHRDAATVAFFEAFGNAAATEHALSDFVLEHGSTAPSFAWVRWAEHTPTSDEHHIQLMVRGNIDLTTNIASVPMLRGATSPTWVEHRVRRFDSDADIVVGTTAEDSTDLTAGIVAAGGFRLNLRTSLGAELAGPPQAIEPAEPRATLVAARCCPADHPNPPHLVRCRICDLAIDTAADTVTVRSPVLAVARLNDGSTIDLTGTKVIGRRPSTDRSRLVGPHDLVGIDAPASVSRTHLIVAASGWLLTVTDCGSSSGTALVDAQESEPMPLQPWVPHELGVGDTVHLGGPTTMTIEEPTS
ncbi:MAG: FHA domain-containing protein [Ilumatobacter sp.]